MIIGLGTDFLSLGRFIKVFSSYEEAMKQKIFTPQEQEVGEKLLGQKKYAFYAKRFSAKEALLKACGVGAGSLLSWKDFSILSESSGKPLALPSERAYGFCHHHYHFSSFRFLVSLSDEKDYVQAFCILEGH